jgi:MoaA/NifB/PqqE/SkfB family radical SAM enzyme
MDSNILKAEILLTRHCNLNCSYCNIVDNSRKSELGYNDWCKAFDNIINVLGAKFLALYGGEPLVKFDLLCELIRYLSLKYPEIDHTVISNSILLTPDRAKELVRAGLKSWTVSADSLSNANARDNAGFKALELFRLLGVKDLAVSITIHKKNLHEVVDLVRYVNSQGYWALFDIIHFDKGGYTFSPKPEKCPEYVLTMEDAPQLQKIAHELTTMYYKEDALIHQLPEFFNYVANPYYSIERNWMCSYPAWITVDSNGYMMCCEDWSPSNTYSHNITEITDQEKWDKFVEVWKKDVSKCKGCLWSGHLLSEIALKAGQAGADYFAHKKRGL